MSMMRECGNDNDEKVSIASSMVTATPMTVIGTTAEVMDWHNSSDDNGDSNSDSDGEALWQQQQDDDKVTCMASAMVAQRHRRR